MKWPFVKRATLKAHGEQVKEIYQRSLERERERGDRERDRHDRAYGELLRLYWRAAYPRLSREHAQRAAARAAGAGKSPGPLVW